MILKNIWVFLIVLTYFGMLLNPGCLFVCFGWLVGWLIGFKITQTLAKFVSILVVKKNQQSSKLSHVHPFIETFHARSANVNLMVALEVKVRRSLSHIDILSECLQMSVRN